MTRAEGLTKTIERLERELTNTRGELSILQRECRHDFTNPVYHPYVQEGYTIPADPPGTMGVDWRGETYVPRKETPRWTRVCKLCEKVEETGETEKHVSHTPKFR